MTQDELKEFIKIHESLRILAWKRGKQALIATETGFGEKCTGYGRVTFGEESVVVTCYDTCYDCHEESSYYMSFEELLMSEEEWITHLEELKEITLMNKELKAEQERVRRLEEKESQFQRLKQELGK